MSIDLQELIQHFAESDYSEFEVAQGDRAVSLKRALVAKPSICDSVENPSSEFENVLSSEGEKETESSGFIAVKANRVGQFFPKVKLGDRIACGEVVGHIKAMNIMNELRCEYEGVVTRMIAQNGEGVAYDELLLELTGEVDEI